MSRDFPMVTVRVPAELRDQFNAACAKNLTTPTQVLRDYILTYSKHEGDIRIQLPRITVDRSLPSSCIAD